MKRRIILMVFGIWLCSEASAWALEWSPLQISLFGEAAQLVPKEKPVYGLKLNVLFGDSSALDGVDIGVVGNVDVMKGIQVNLIQSSASTRDIERRSLQSYGIQIAGLRNGAGLFNGSPGAAFNGAEIALGFNYAGLMRGFQAALVANYAMVMHGFQAALVYNGAEKMQGVQLGSLTGASSLNGLQLGIVNICLSNVQGTDSLPDVKRADSFSDMQFGPPSGRGDLSGMQIGVFNWSSSIRGVQIGIVNATNSLYGVQIGLVNIAKNGRIPWIPIVNFAF